MPQKIIKEFEVYNYNELGDSAKQTARSLVYDAIVAGRCETLMGDLVEYCEEKYGLHLDENSIFYNFSNSQGDGVCFTYDNLVDYVNLTETSNLDLDELNIFERVLVEQSATLNLDLLLEYLKDGFNTVSIFRNSARYTHANTCTIDFTLYYNEDGDKEEEINNYMRNLCDNVIRKIYNEVCKDLEDYGYQLLEIPEEDIETYIDDFDLKFLEDGRIFSE